LQKDLKYALLSRSPPDTTEALI